jgi:uncharacterized protein
MIHHTVTFMFLTTSHLALVIFTMDSYSIDAAICSQTQATTNRQDHFSSTVYQQMAATDTTEGLNSEASTLHNELNAS